MTSLIGEAGSWENDVELISGRLRESVSAQLGRMALSSVNDAVELAISLHKGQQRDEGIVYAVHPLRVALRLVQLIESYPHPQDSHPIDRLELVQTALLHDTIEDCEDAYSAISSRIGERICALVELLSRRAGPRCVTEGRAVYFCRLRQSAEGVRAVKILDNLDNLRGLMLSKKNTIARLSYLQTTFDFVLPLAQNGLSELVRFASDDLAQLASTLQRRLRCEN